MVKGVPRVFLSGLLPPTAMERLAGLDLEYWAGEGNLPRERLLEEASRADGLLTFLTDRVDEELLAKAPRLRVVANMAVGYDNFDLAAVVRHGVLLTNTPDVLTEATADLAFGLLLAAARRFREGRDWLESGRWQSWHPLLLAGQEIGNSTLGIVGLGRIGQAMARRARAFRMRILYWGRHRRPEAEQDMGAQFVSLEELLAESDFVSLHCLLSPETRHLIGRDELAKMKSTAVLVNTARGQVVDQTALLDALREGQIFAAGLDVFEVEPIPHDDPLLALPNVVALPHLGSATVATRTAMALRAVDNLRAGLSGKRPPDLLNREVWRG